MQNKLEIEIVYMYITSKYLNLDFKIEGITHKREHQEIISLTLKGIAALLFRSPGYSCDLLLDVFVRCRA